MLWVKDSFTLQLIVINVTFPRVVNVSCNGIVHGCFAGHVLTLKMHCFLVDVLLSSSMTNVCFEYND